MRSRVPLVEGQALASSPYIGAACWCAACAAPTSPRSSRSPTTSGRARSRTSTPAAASRIGTRLADDLVAQARRYDHPLTPRGASTAAAPRPGSRRYPVAAISRSACRSSTPLCLHAACRGAELFQPRRRRERHRGRSSTTPTGWTRPGSRRDGGGAAGGCSPTGVSATRTFFGALEVERNVMFLILTLIVLVAALNIISGLIMLVRP